MNRRVAACVGLVVLVACGGAATTAPEAPKPTGLNLPSPARNIHVRATFDDDPTAYVGRFVPSGTKPDELDENGATTTRCSRFFKTKVVNVQQDMDEVMYASKQASATLGIVPFGGASANSNAATTLRVKYTIQKKIQVVPDVEGLDACCKADPKQCSEAIIGEFYFGSGQILQAVQDDRSASGNARYQQVTGGADYKEALSWKKVSDFKDMYFAFQTSKTPLGLGGAEASASDCSWCDKLPGSLDGKYFCGVSTDAPSESMARDLAMRSAREQAVKYLGEYVSTASATTSSVTKGILDDKQLVTALAQGVASNVKDEKWCKAETVPTPEGNKYRSRVLAYFPNAQSKAAAKDAILQIIEQRKKDNRLTKEQEAELRNLADGLK